MRASSDGLRRATPAAQGIDPQAVSAFLDAVTAEGMELHGFMAWRRGAVFAEGWWHPYRADRPHMLHSLVKSFTATGVGLAVDAGLLSLDDKVVSFFPGELPAVVDERLAAMTVRHLLTMATGHETGLSGGQWRTIRTSWVAEFFKEPLVEPPGQRFIYSSATSYMLSAIVQKVTGETLHRYMTPRFFAPLGIAGVQWDTCPNGINTGGNGISCTAADLVKFAVVHLQGGVWEGRLLLSQEWVEAATRASLRDVALGVFDGRRYRPARPGEPQATREGYGYQWWIGPGTSYYAAGLFGQYAMVFPEQEAVVVLTGATRHGHSRLVGLAHRHLVAAMAPASLPEDAGPRAALKARLAGLRLPPERPGTASPLEAAPPRTFAMAPNEDRVSHVSLDLGGRRVVFALTDHRGTHTVTAGLDAPVEGDTTMTGRLLHHQYQPESMRVVASAAWEAPDLLRMTWVFIETAFRDTVLCRFAGDGIAIDRSVNVNSSATERPTLHGRATAQAAE